MQHHRLKTTKINHCFFLVSVVGNFLLVFSFLYFFKYLFSDDPAYQELHPFIYVLGILSGIALYIYATYKVHESKFFIRFDHDTLEYYLPGKDNKGMIHKSEIESVDIHHFFINVRTNQSDSIRISLDHLLYKDILRIKDWFQSFK